MERKRLRVGVVYNFSQTSTTFPLHSEEMFTTQIAQALLELSGLCDPCWVSHFAAEPERCMLDLPTIPYSDNKELDILISVPVNFVEQAGHPIECPAVLITHEGNLRQDVLDNTALLVGWSRRHRDILSRETGREDTGFWHPGYKHEVRPVPCEWDVITMLRPVNLLTSLDQCLQTVKQAKFIEQLCLSGVKVLAVSSGYLELTCAGYELLETLCYLPNFRFSGRIPRNYFQSVLASSPVYFDPLSHQPYFVPAECIAVGESRIIRQDDRDEYLTTNPYNVPVSHQEDSEEENMIWHQKFEQAFYNQCPAEWAATQAIVREEFDFGRQVDRLADIIKKVAGIE